MEEECEIAEDAEMQQEPEEVEQQPEEEEEEQPEEDYIIYDVPELTTQQTSVYHPNRPFRVVKVKEVMRILDRTVLALNDAIGMGLDWCLVLLRECNWDSKKCEAQFIQEVDKKKLLESCAYTPKPYQIQDKVASCNICLEEGPSKYVALGCDHEACWGCWKDYVQEQLSNRVAFFRCFNENCEVPVPRSLIERILQDDSQRTQLFHKCLGDKYLQRNSKMKFCPGADCDKCIRVQELGVKEVECECGTKFCFGCCQPRHRPCECVYVKQWKDTVLGDEANEKWIALNTKTCPFCKRHVQRSEGCNFMACKPPGGCGESFCYVCSKPWLPDHKDHFNCNVRKEQERLDEEEKMRIQRLKAERIEFYCDKYVSNQTCSDQLGKYVKNSQEIRDWLFDNLGIALQESDFIPKVYAFAIEACRVLKWSYVFRYFLDDHSPQISNFEIRQGVFERFKENLLYKLSTKLIKLYNDCREQLEKGQVPLDRQAKAKEFRETREEILSFYRSAEDFMKVLIETIENEMI